MLCLRALKRIFLMCDTNQDGSLSDFELNTFQQICFNAPLTEEELQSVKQVGGPPTGDCEEPHSGGGD